VKKLTRGKPFKPGPDPRRHMSGRKCKDAITFTAEYTRALTEGGDPVEIAALLWKKALAGQPWAIEMIIDRLCGKLPATVLQTAPIFKIIYEPAADTSGHFSQGNEGGLA
jgi:hypothetical protein